MPSELNIQDLQTKQNFRLPSCSATTHPECGTCQDVNISFLFDSKLEIWLKKNREPSFVWQYWGCIWFVLNSHLTEEINHWTNAQSLSGIKLPSHGGTKYKGPCVSFAKFQCSPMWLFGISTLNLINGGRYGSNSYCEIFE